MSYTRFYKTLIICVLVIFSSEKLTAQSGTLTVNEDPKISELLNLKKTLEKENKLADGYTIQLYYGNLSKANSVIRNYRNRYAEWPATIEYETPNYKVWVGNYTRRIEADRALMEIQKAFPSAFILKPSKKD